MNNTQVAHLWASGSKQSGKGSNFYFEGDTIFSYGAHFPIARRVTEGFYLITESRYSHSTSRHISYTKRAIPSFAKVFSVKNCPDSSFDVIRIEKMEEARERLANVEGNNAFKTYENAKSLSLFCRDALEMFCWMKRESDPTFEWLPIADEMHEIIGKAEMIAETNREAYEIALAKKQEQQEARNANREAKYQRQRELDKMEALEFVPLWRAGEGNYQWKFRSLPPMLRIKGSLVQTSQGAEVSLEDAKKAFSFIIAKINKGIEWHRNGETCEVGAFSLISIDSELVTIGCHKFTIDEVKAFGELLA
jgi:dsDNA-binding SOS-regulon protein